MDRSFLEPQKQYEVTLDLSLYAYFERRSAGVGGEVKKLIEDAIVAGSKTITLTVRPLLFGRGLERAPKFEPELNLKLTLERLKTPSADQAREDSAVLARLGRGEISIDEAAARLEAGRVTIPIRTTEFSGCGQVVFSIWDESGKRPLDYVVHTVSVRNTGDPVPKCEGTKLQSGFRSLSGIVTAGGDVDADAALQIIEFDTPNGPITEALFVDAEQYRLARADSTLTDRGVYAWPLITPLETYVGGQQQLLALIISARKLGNYASAARELEKRLFPKADESGSDDSRALQALVALAKRKPNPPVVLVRALTAQNVPVYIPLSLLASKDANILSQRISVIHPLPRERYEGANVCVDRWSLGVPQKIDGLPDTISLTPSERMSRYPTVPELVRFLDTKASSSLAAGRSEALVLLAHQGEGNLWFTDNGTGERVIPEDYQRQYPPGSLALLSACSAVNPKDDNELVVKLLNDHGIDVVVGSPFPVEVSYGVELTRSFIRAADEAYSRKSTPTVVELFNTAAAIAAEELKDKAEFKEKVLEFVIVGDHELRLCND